MLPTRRSFLSSVAAGCAIASVESEPAEREKELLGRGNEVAKAAAQAPAKPPAGR